MNSSSEHSKIKIVWLHSHLLQWSGAARFLFEVTRRLAKIFDVTLWVERADLSTRQLFEAAGVSVHECNSRTSTSLLYWLFFPYYLRKSIQAFAGKKSEFKVAISSMFPMNVVCHKTRFTPHLQYLFEPFAFFYDTDLINGYPLAKRLLLRLLSILYGPWDQRAAAQADKLMTINHGTAHWVHHIYHRNASTSLLGVDAMVFSPKNDARSEALKQKYAGRTILIHSTDYTPCKRTEKALWLTAQLKEKFPSILLWITESHPNEKQRQELMNQVKSWDLTGHVEFLGVLPQEELPYFYAQADISLYTGIGQGVSAASLFVLECMACETPGVRTNFTDDEIEDGVSGFLVPPKDDNAFLEAITTLLANEPRRRSFGKSARERILKRYHWDQVAGRFAENLTQLIVREKDTLRD